MSPIVALYLGAVIGWATGWGIHKAICDHFHGPRRRR